MAALTNWFVGDENGNIKYVSVVPAKPEEIDPRQPHINLVPTSKNLKDGKPGAGVQRLNVRNSEERSLLSVAHGDGTAAIYDAQPSKDKLVVVKEWDEPKFRPTCRYIGLDVRPQGIFTCTSIGHFRLTRLEGSNETATAALPVRLRDLKMSSSGENFAYGGEEVDLSVWNTERALSGPSVSSSSDAVQAGQKRKKSKPTLLYGEIWRAKNVANDSLSLRQPVNISSLAFLSEGQGNHHHLATGNELGSVRRYDTRASKQPVADWVGISKVGGVRRIEKGSRDHELFAADSTTNLLCLDLRNGRVLYGYQGLSGSIDSLATAAGSNAPVLASTSLDRYFRLHSTVPLPDEAGGKLDHKGHVIGKLFLKSTPTAVVWADQGFASSSNAADDHKVAEDTVWDNMERTSDVEEENGRARKRKKAE